ncbi:MAG: ABC transporter permease [Rhodobacteraceae bacterium]|nr:ABC transporter permease [Paracoccaceae bacterium]
MTGPGLIALAAHWRRNPLQLFTLVAGLALATALWSGVQAVNMEARASYDAAAATVGEGRFDQLLPRVGDTIAQTQFIALRRAGWQVGPVLEGRIATAGGSLRIVGLDPLTSPGGMGPANRDGAVDLTRMLTDPPLFANAEVARRLEGLGGMTVVVTPDVAANTAITDIGHAQRLLDRPGAISRLIVARDQPLGRPPLEQIAPDLVVQPAQAGGDIGRLTDSFHLNLTAFGLLSFAVGIFIVHGAIGLAFEQRRGMVRTLRALGMPLRRLMALMMAELTVLAFVAGGIGMVLGYAIAGLLLPDVAATLEGLYGADIANTLRLRPEWWVSGMAIAFLGTALAAGGSLARISAMPLLETARAGSMVRGRRTRLALAGAAGLAVAGAGAAVWGQGMIMGFAVLACLLLGAALLLPPALETMLRAFQRRASGAKWQWFWADTRLQLPGLSLALMALLLAMAANVGVSTMVSSFRATFTAFLDQRLAAELYVTADTPSQAAALQAFVAPRAREVLPLLSVPRRMAGNEAELHGIRVGPTYRENWRFLAGDSALWDRVADGTAVIVNEQLARRAGLWLGDPLAVAPGLSLPIAGIFGDYGNPVGQAIVSDALFADLFPDRRATRFGLRTDDPDALRRDLTEVFGLDAGRIVDQAAIKSFSLGVFERTFTVTAALNVLTLAVAGFAILMSLLTLSAMRVPQLAPAWALGLTRRELGRLEVIRAMVLAAFTAAAALPLGLALAWMLLAVVNVAAFGWRLPMFLFPADYARLGLLTVLAALLAALWPAVRLARTPPEALLRVFAHER